MSIRTIVEEAYNRMLNESWIDKETKMKMWPDRVFVDSKSESVRHYVSNLNFKRNKKFHVTKTEDGFLITREKKKDGSDLRSQVLMAMEETYKYDGKSMLDVVKKKIPLVRNYVSLFNERFGHNHGVRTVPGGVEIWDRTDNGNVPRRIIELSKLERVTAENVEEMKGLLRDFFGVYSARVVEGGQNGAV